ncbi:MAG: hypothetical protein E7627_00185 [Ruminococcaceae bacterium]|nr:hypothetical protein [Oscillospiraceae bacterium]
MDTNKVKKTRIGALDIFIIIALVVCVVAIGVRMYVNSISDVGEQVALEDYVVTFKVLDIKDTSAKNYFEPNTNFYLKDVNTLFGTIREGITVNDAEKEYQMPNGDVVIAQNNATGDLYRVDVEVSANVKGRIDAEGRFLLNGNTYIGANKEIEIYSKYLAVTAIITSVEKAQ